jgi:putative transposase
MTRSRYRIYEDHYPYFLTCTVVGWLPVFTRSQTVQILYDSLQFLHDTGRMTLYGYVILENHLHLIAASPDLSKEIGDFKSFTARKIIDYLEQTGARTLLKLLRFFRAHHKTDRTYQLWQEGSHPEQIQNDDMMRQKLEYIHKTPSNADTWMSRRTGVIRVRGIMRASADCFRFVSIGDFADGRRHATRSVGTCVPTRSVGTRGVPSNGLSHCHWP